MKPEPTPRGTSSCGCAWFGLLPRGAGCCGIGTPKKRRKNSCISSSPGPDWAGLALIRSVVRILTTAGPVFSTISAKSGRLTIAPAGAACAVLNWNITVLHSSADKHKVVKREVVFIGSSIYLKFGCDRSNGLRQARYADRPLKHNDK